MKPILSEVAVGKVFNVARMFRRNVCAALKAGHAVWERLSGDAPNCSGGRM